MRVAGWILVLAACLAGLLAPVAAPHGVDDRLPGLLNVPPTRPHVVDEAGAFHAPFTYSWTLVNQLEQRYEEDRRVRIPLAWFRDGRVVRSSEEPAHPLLLLGADSYGRDVFGRLLFGARTSLALSFIAAFGAVLLGASVGGAAGYSGGAFDDLLMRTSDFVLVLPAMYVALGLRSVLPIVLSAPMVFALLATIFAIVGAPFVARGVRAIVRTESKLDYALAARSLGAGHWRMLTRHLLPAAAGFIAVQITMLVPAFVVAEATLSYVGLGFPEPVASWGTMLHEASNVRAFADFPWLLSPAAAMFLVVLGLNLLLQSGPEARAHKAGADPQARRGVQSF
jgi:peptide/nickel transport system permease protein